MDLHAAHEAGATIAAPGALGTMRLDSFNASAFELAIRQLIDETDDTLILDLQSVSYLSSAGIRVLVVAAKELEARKREFRVCSLSKPVAQTLTTSNIVSVLRVCKDRSEALADIP